MPTVVASLAFRACLAALTVSSISIGQAAAVPHAHVDASDKVRHAGLPPHFHVSWLVGSRPVVRTPLENRNAANPGRRWAGSPPGTAHESDAVFLIDVGRSPVAEACFRQAWAFASCTVDLPDHTASPAVGNRRMVERRNEPDDSDLYLAVKRLRI